MMDRKLSHLKCIDDSFAAQRCLSACVLCVITFLNDSKQLHTEGRPPVTPLLRQPGKKSQHGSCVFSQPQCPSLFSRQAGRECGGGSRRGSVLQEAVG